MSDIIADDERCLRRLMNENENIILIRDKHLIKKIINGATEGFWEKLLGTVYRYGGAIICLLLCAILFLNPIYLSKIPLFTGLVGVLNDFIGSPWGMFAAIMLYAVAINIILTVLVAAIAGEKTHDKNKLYLDIKIKYTINDNLKDGLKLTKNGFGTEI